uniref:Uncharacterized protein n=1 Tax=Meloidogyne enterolobii TaxID=390850 RepID=A0A6V7XVH7_MELEN|nr:unnamed protein product [Meloidogyne enterolobii]
MDYVPIPISSNITTWFLLAVFIFVGLSGFVGNLLTVMIWLIIIIWFISFFPSLFIGLQFKLVIQDFCGHTHVHSNGLGSKCDFVGWSGNYGSGENYTFEVKKLKIKIGMKIKYYFSPSCSCRDENQRGLSSAFLDVALMYRGLLVHNTLNLIRHGSSLMHFMYIQMCTRE